jgi:GTPase SAR1 family protein
MQLVKFQRSAKRSESSDIMIDEWVKEIKENCDPESLGMILVRNGIVRGTAENGSENVGCPTDQ